MDHCPHWATAPVWRQPAGPQSRNVHTNGHANELSFTVAVGIKDDVWHRTILILLCVHEWCPQSNMPCSPRTCDNKPHAPSKRLKIFQWNCSGLSLAKMDELCHWMTLQSLDIAILSETRWTFCNDWLQAHWAIIHSGASYKGSGVMVLVNRHLCKSDAITWTPIYDGHLLHVRLPGFERPVDIIACYQLMNDRTPARLRQRALIWTALDEYLQRLPNRNELAVVGDFNCGTIPLCGHTGPEHFKWDGHMHAGIRHPDTDRFMDIIRQHGLVALNTWDTGLGPTYVHGSVATRIDFVLTRHSHVDFQAKQVRILHDAPFMTSHEYCHFPLISSLPKIRIMNRAPHLTGFNLRQRCQLRQEWLADTDRWHSMCESLKPTVANCMADSSAQVVTHLHNVINPTVSRFLKDIHVTHPSSAHSSHHDQLESKWKHTHMARKLAASLPISGLRAWFRCWFHVTRANVLQRTHKKYASQIRKTKFFALVQEAEYAAAHHDSCKLHQLIRQVAPKVPKRRIQLRNAQGALALPQEELAIYTQYVRDVWNKPDVPLQHLARPPGVPFSMSDLRDALAHIPVTKSVAAPFLPGLIVRTMAHEIAVGLYPLLQHWWSFNPPLMPQVWRDGWLVFLPKPLKSTDCPQNLRPLALQEPIGKAIAGLLVDHLNMQAFSTSCRWPQMAYLRFRSTQDAICRVSAHCASVKLLLQSQRRHVLHRASDQPTFSACGGIQLFIDLSKAFDSVKRSQLFSNLSDCGISENIVQLVQALHTGTCYHLFHKGKYYPIEVNVGVRQGCKLAPALWACFMTTFLRQAAERISPNWVQSHITVYADDFHVGVKFHPAEELWDTVRHFGTLLDLLHEFGLTVNVAKSQIILALAGTNHRKLMGKLLRFDHAGPYISIPRVHGWDHFRVTASATYLGTVVSYRNYEDLTIKSRISSARANFRRLRRWLICKKLSVKHRLRLWSSCILSTLTYGIFTVGLTKTGIHSLQTTMYQMLRQILGDHAYVTGHSHQTVLHQHNCAEPLHLLLTAALALQKSITQREPQLAHYDIVLALDWTPLQQAIQMLHDALTQGPAVPVVSDPHEVPNTLPVLHCPYCDFSTTNLANFNRHCTNIHQDPKMRIHSVNLRLDALGGLPQCRHCLAKFTTWHAFKTHVERRACQALPPASAVVHPTCTSQVQTVSLDFVASSSNAGLASLRVPPLDRDRMNSAADDDALRVKLLPSDLAHLNSTAQGQFILEVVNSMNWPQLQDDPAACALLSKHCALCVASLWAKFENYWLISSSTTLTSWIMLWLRVPNWRWCMPGNHRAASVPNISRLGTFAPFCYRLLCCWLMVEALIINKVGVVSFRSWLVKFVSSLMKLFLHCNSTFEALIVWPSKIGISHVTLWEALHNAPTAEVDTAAMKHFAGTSPLDIVRSLTMPDLLKLCRLTQLYGPRLRLAMCNNGSSQIPPRD